MKEKSLNKSSDIYDTVFTIKSPPKKVHPKTAVLKIIDFSLILLGLLQTIKAVCSYLSHCTNDDLLLAQDGTGHVWPLDLHLKTVMTCILIPIALFSERYMTETAKQNVCKVEIMPLGVQLSYYSEIHQKKIRNSLCDVKTIQRNKTTKFISREDIIDLIVAEVILSYKVINCITFRVKNKCSAKNDDYIDDRCCQQFGNDIMSRENKLSLIPLFPRHHILMDYNECGQVWKGMMKTIHHVYHLTGMSF